MGSPTGREAHGDGVLVVPNREGCNSLTQTDGRCAVGSLTTERVTQYVGEQGKENRWLDNQPR
jgi:hypothetical protein